MANLWESFKNMFQAAEESSPANPFIHELIERSTEEKEDFHQWKEQLVRRRLSSWLIDQYALFKVDTDLLDEAIDFLDTPSSKGFAMHFHKTQYTLREARHFLDYLKEQVLLLKYRTQISDLRTYQKPQWVESIERHYVKPRPDFNSPGKYKQAFGNIRMELKIRNDRPHQLTFSATTYKDHLFEAPQEFEQLMQSIL